ncbi:uncharacterized protein CLUP02_17727 [Colletotrichum lupini]|uniref:Uncharacterized protein n=1 Tax=Colletotrichum lupini TaxID=145971 RepID=A0A9Q8SF94_9PEZI|nr:uncharacterized protein CLUP02_17727 [Colletotrichum lupini]UQC76214.1 hypothetical protein CLUP02_17727 [Colletotrichum lupini]
MDIRMPPYYMIRTLWIVKVHPTIGKSKMAFRKAKMLKGCVDSWRPQSAGPEFPRGSSRQGWPPDPPQLTFGAYFVMSPEFVPGFNDFKRYLMHLYGTA